MVADVQRLLAMPVGRCCVKFPVVYARQREAGSHYQILLMNFGNRAYQAQAGPNQAAWAAQSQHLRNISRSMLSLATGLRVGSLSVKLGLAVADSVLAQRLDCGTLELAVDFAEAVTFEDRQNRKCPWHLWLFCFAWHPRSGLTHMRRACNKP